MLAARAFSAPRHLNGDANIHSLQLNFFHEEMVYETSQYCSRNCNFLDTPLPSAYYRVMRIYVPAKADWTCPNCQQIHSLRIERDDIGGYIDPETLNCVDDDCAKKLCGKCPQRRCDACSFLFCPEHMQWDDEDSEWLCRNCRDAIRLADLARMDDQETQRRVAGIAREEVQG